MPHHEVTSWRDDPEVQHWLGRHDVARTTIATVSVNAYKRWLISEVEKLPGWSADPVDPYGREIQRSQVLELLKQEDTRAPL